MKFVSILLLGLLAVSTIQAATNPDCVTKVVNDALTKWRTDLISSFKGIVGTDVTGVNKLKTKLSDQATSTVANIKELISAGKDSSKVYADVKSTLTSSVQTAESSLQSFLAAYKRTPWASALKNVVDKNTPALKSIASNVDGDIRKCLNV